MNAWKKNRDARLPPLLILLFWLIGCMPGRADAALVHALEENGQRDVFSFPLLAGQKEPVLELQDPKTLRVTIPGQKSIPYDKAKIAKANLVESIKLEEILDGEMGLYLTLFLKEPLLDFYGRVQPPPDNQANTSNQPPVYRLGIERPVSPITTGPVRILGARILPGRDGTLAVFSVTGPVQVHPTIDYGAGVLKLVWTGASEAPSWQPPAPGGLIERLLDYPFAKHVEMELSLHKAAGQAFFYAEPQAGLFVVEIREKGPSGRETSTLKPGEEAKQMVIPTREAEAQKLFTTRMDALAKGIVIPLNRLTNPIFDNPPDKVTLSRTPVDEAYFFDKAKESERQQNFAQARAYLNSLVETFPKTPNREVIDLYKLSLGNRIERQPGTVLDELDEIFARHPNTKQYARLRLQQLRSFNNAEQYQNAAAIMFDPNLPKNDPEVLLERGRTYMEMERWDDADKALRSILTMEPLPDKNKAEAYFLLARLASRQAHGDQAATILDGLSPELSALLANRPGTLQEMADIYFNSGRFPQAYNMYIRFLDNYPRDPSRAPWALLRIGDINRRMGKIKESEQTFQRLALQFPKSQAMYWQRIYKIRLDEKRPLEERLKDLDAIIAEKPLAGATSEAQFSQALLLGEAKRFHEAMARLNHLLVLSSRGAIVNRVNILKKNILETGMTEAVESGRPEQAVALAESFGSDWSQKADFDRPRVLLAEALLRIGLPERVPPLLNANKLPEAAEFTQLLRSMKQAPEAAAATEADGGATRKISPPAARVVLAEAGRLAKKEQWNDIMNLLENLPESVFNPDEKERRLRLLAMAATARGRFPQAVGTLEKLLFEKPVRDGRDYYWYATILQDWQGDDKSLPAFNRVATESTNKEVQALAHMRIGDILQRKGDLPGSQKAFQEASSLDPESAWGRVARENALHLKMVQSLAVE
ncbi:MAG: tetratricopeptide repeat protein [Magnetococcales bacterium]|nr:tetratricopeptide repeat protein [Magnetococcales bacterium]